MMLRLDAGCMPMSSRETSNHTSLYYMQNLARGKNVTAPNLERPSISKAKPPLKPGWVAHFRTLNLIHLQVSLLVTYISGYIQPIYVVPSVCHCDKDKQAIAVSTPPKEYDGV